MKDRQLQLRVNWSHLADGRGIIRAPLLNGFVLSFLSQNSVARLHSISLSPISCVTIVLINVYDVASIAAFSARPNITTRGLCHMCVYVFRIAKQLTNSYSAWTDMKPPLLWMCLLCIFYTLTIMRASTPVGRMLTVGVLFLIRPEPK